MHPRDRSNAPPLPRTDLRVVASAGLLAIAALACSHNTPPPAAPPPAPVRGAPLPQGWVWPPSAGIAATKAFLPGVVRPVDAARLRSANPGAGCRPIEVTPGFFVMPMCAPLPVMSFAGSSYRRHRLNQSLPVSMDLRAMGLDGPVKDQQQVGVCWSFAISTLMDNGIRRAARGDVVAPLHVLASDAWSQLFRNGKGDRAFALEPTWPYDPVKACKLNESQSEVWCEQAYHVQHGSWRQDPALVGEVERANATGVYRISKMETLNDPKDPEEYAEIIARGQAVYGSFEIDSQEWGQARGGVINDYAVGNRGGHGVAVVGYRMGRGRELLIHNSWGADWGAGGYAWISEGTVRAHARDAFVIEVEAGVPGQLPIPTGQLPIPGLGSIPGIGSIPGLPQQLPFQIPGLPGIPGMQGTTPAQGQQACAVRDVVFGSCAAACPSGSPPVAGICAPSAPQASSGVPQCAAGQVLDFTTNTCVAQCPNGLPPIAGRCF